MKPVTTPILATLLVVALVVGAVGGYLVSSQLSNSKTSQSAFLPYTDNYGGRIDDSNSGFVTNAPLVAGFSRGQIAWYWFVGPTNNTLNPIYLFRDQSGAPVRGQFPIVDVKPGDAGYAHFWEIMNVAVPNSYVANAIKSLDSLKRAQQTGIVTITDSKEALNGPIVARNVKTQVVNGEPQISPVWYRTGLMTMAMFEQNLPGGGGIPAIPIWLIQRSNESYPLLEWVAQKDFNHDEQLTDSNDLIDQTPGQPGYSPLWSVLILHVKSTYLPRGFPPFPGNPAVLSSQYGMFTSIQDASADQAKASPVYVNLSAPGTSRGLQATNMLVNCPALPPGTQPSGVPAG